MKLLPPLTDEDKMLSGLCYPLWPIAPAFILWSPKKDDPFLLYHAYQGLGFGGFASAATLVVFVVLSLMFRLLPGGSVLVPGMLGVATFGAGLLAFLGVFLVALFLGWRASAGDMFALPLVGEWAEERMLMASGFELGEELFLLTVRVSASAGAEYASGDKGDGERGRSTEHGSSERWAGPRGDRWISHD